MHRRIAAHYIWYRSIYKMHFIELDEQDAILSIRPLEEEIAGTEFYNGVIIPVLRDTVIEESLLLKDWQKLTQEIKPGMPVWLYHLEGISQTTAELGTDDGSSSAHIKRL